MLSAEMTIGGQAMQNLRDQLLRAGMISKDQKRQTEQQKRQERKQQKPGHHDEMLQTQQRQAYEAKLEAQRAADRERAAAQRALQETREKHLQIRHIIDYWQVPMPSPGDCRWYFTTRQNTITYLDVPAPIATQLGKGDVAIVEYPEETDLPYVLIDHEAAELIARVDPMYVRFYNTEPAHEV
jgi:uncharacterized protein YaiL (DUF2058 family)